MFKSHHPDSQGDVKERWGNAILIELNWEDSQELPRVPEHVFVECMRVERVCRRGGRMLGSVGYFSRGIHRRLSSASLRQPIRILHQLIFPTTSSHFLKGKLKNRDVSAAIMVACTKNAVVMAAMLWSYKWSRPLIITRADRACHPAMPNSNSNCSRVNASSSAASKTPWQVEFIPPSSPLQLSCA